MSMLVVDSATDTSLIVSGKDQLDFFLRWRSDYSFRWFYIFLQKFHVMSRLTKKSC